MIATQVLSESDFEVNLDNSSETDVVGFLTAENKEHVIKKGENKIGRDPSVCLIVLESFTVSKIHAVIESDGIDETFIYDVGSTNQTKLGKKSLKPHCRYKIDDKSVITFGNVVAEFKTQSSIDGKKTILDITPPYSGSHNKSNIYDDDDIFELSTQVEYLQPSTSGEIKMSKKSSEDSHIFKVPAQKNFITERKASPEPSQNCFDAETQCQLNVPEFSQKENSFCDVPDSGVFNLNTQQQSPKSFSQELNREKVLEGDEKENDNEDLLNDGHDDILFSVSLQSPSNEHKPSQTNITNDDKEEKEHRDNEGDKEKHNQNENFNDSFLDITINDLEPLDTIDSADNQENSSLKPCEKIKIEDDEATQEFNVETYKEFLEKKSLVVEESSDEETQTYSNEINNDDEKSDVEDLISTQTYTTNVESDKNNKLDTFKKPREVSENDKIEDFVSTQLFSDFGEKNKNDNKNNEENSMENDENEDFLATQLFSGPVNNFEKTNKSVENPEMLEGVEECEDFLATQLFSGPVNNFEKSKGKHKSSQNSSIVEEIHESEDFLATQLFSQPVDDFEDKVEQNEQPTSSQNEESQDFLATQIFPENEKTFSNSETTNTEKENENLVETQLFPDSNVKRVEDSGSKNIESSNPHEDCEDFLATQVFEVSDRQESPIRESSPDLLSLSDRPECSQDFIGTQLFPVNDSNSKDVVIKTENIKQETPINPHVSDSFSDNTESDLEVITDKGDSFSEKVTSPQSCLEKTLSKDKSIDDIHSDNSNSSYVFEVENLQADSEINTTNTSNAEMSKRESDTESEKESPGKKKSNFWDCLSLEMPSTQDVEKTLRKANSECIQKPNYEDEKSKNVKVNKRSRKNDSEVNEIPIKKSRISNKNCRSDEKQLSKLWQTHDIKDIRTTRTRQSVKTPYSKDSSEKTTDRKRKSKQKVQETESVGDDFWSSSSKRSHSPQIELNFNSCRRVLRSSRSLRFESPVAVEKYSTTISSNHKNVPSRKLRKTSRRKSGNWSFSGSCVNIAFTGFECELLEKIIAELKGKKMEVLSVCNVVVTDKVRRTVKFLCAIGLGLPIASPEWLLASKTEKEFLNPWDFILKDEDSEEKWEFDLKSSLEKSRKTKLMKGMSVFATKSTKPPPQELLAIVECCGGVPLTSHPEVWPKKTIIASCLEDEEYWPTVKPSQVHIVHYECILSGVLRQKLDIKRFKLN